MIISQTPFRVSFAGGGTDLPAFYEREYGAVFSVAIQHHMYVTVHKRFEDNVRISYSQTELADTVDAIQHELVREAMKSTQSVGPIEVTTIADVPAGTGLGSSSTLSVGLVNAFNAHHGKITSASVLAEEACRIEIDRLGHPIGKQDQYAAAFGGVNYIRFDPSGAVDVEPVPLKAETRNEFERHILMVYTAQQRKADDILAKQSEGTADKMSVLRAMRDLAQEMRHSLTGVPDFRRFAELLHEGWLLKSSLGFGITNAGVDQWYEAALGSGAWGGKLLGAGGGGFLLLFAPPESHGAILESLDNPKRLPFQIDPLGSRIVFISE